MSDTSRLENLTTGLGMEILTARAGSQDGQFPILDLLGNLRDEFAKKPGNGPAVALLNERWERMAGVVESGRAFTAEDIGWLNDTLTRVQAYGSGAPVSVAAPEPKVSTAAPTPVTPPAPAEAKAADEGDGVLNLDLSADAEMLREFLTESREHLDNIEEGVLVLETNPEDAETLNTVFRAFHTFKGGAGFLNLVPINRLAHVLESLLDLARQRKLSIDKEVIDLILRGRDTLRHFLDRIDEQISGAKAPQPIDIPTAGLKRDVQSLIDAVKSGTVAERAAAKPVVPVAAEVHETVASDGSPKAEPRAPKGSPEEASSTARVDHNTVVKVETGKLDALLDLVGEMVISQSLVAAGLGDITDVNPQYARNMAQLSRITKELQRVSMSMRMVPVRGAFQKMARVVRDIGAKQNKKVQLVTEGEDTELDRGVVEQLNDPLLHLIRNSMDHGIEKPEVREAKGKPAVGTIRLSAFHQGGNIVIEISDDGSGLNRDRILAKAIEKGLVASGDGLSDEQVFAFIFGAGFSTAEKVTDLSGRGVGLDVVRRNIETLRGSVDIDSKAGFGTKFRLTLPLTLAIIDGLVVKVGPEQYILPTVSVRESFRLTAGMITSVRGHGEVVNVRGKLIPMLRLYELFAIKPLSTDPTAGIGIVVQSGADARCIIVDALVTQQEVVIKNLNDLMAHKNEYLAGAAILGDGRVGLILDVNSLVHPDIPGYRKSAA